MYPVAAAADALETTTASHTMGALLEPALAAAGLEAPGVAHRALRELGLASLRDVGLLDASELAELRAALSLAGLALGDRSKLRLLSAKVATVELDAAEFELQGRLTGSLPLPTKDGHMRRTLQETGSKDNGLSSESVAIILTATLGILSFFVQAKVARDAAEQAKQVDRDREEGDKQRARAAVLLDRVRSQVEDFNRPLLMHFSVFSNSMIFLGLEIGLSMGKDFGEWKLFSPPSQPHAVIYSQRDPRVFKSVADKPLWKLDDMDLAILGAEPSKQQRWVDVMTELSSSCLEPVSQICRDLFHLHERFELANMDSFLLGMGQPTSSWVASPSHIFTMLDSYTLEWQMLTKLWSVGDYSRLQPYMPGVIWPATTAAIQMTQICSKRQLELSGISSGSISGGNVMINIMNNSALGEDST
jgi:hypothetical protein